MEINVFCPSGIDVAEEFEKVNFSADVVASLEKKVDSRNSSFVEPSTVPMAALTR